MHFVRLGKASLPVKEIMRNEAEDLLLNLMKADIQFQKAHNLVPIY